MKRILVFPHRYAIEYLKSPELERGKVCWVAVFRPAVPDAAKAVRPDYFAFLEFDDVADEEAARNFGLLPLSEEEALYAADTLLRALDAGVQEFVFSCDAGISRSAGMAEAFARFLEEQGLAFEKKHLRFPQPNPLVRERLLRALKTLDSSRG
ncbi:MAG: hypothetical protein GXO17_03415 [Thermodesulfobacteria bacterium]|nr:hypothetical protein [Thermodesulfobacteriota bacterium]